jgi:flotillin
MMDIGGLIFIGVVVFVALVLVAIVGVKNLIYICAPNEVLIFSGGRHFQEGRSYGYILVKGGRRIRRPLMERVDRMDLTNMVIDLTATAAYSKGGIPLAVQGVANVKIAGHEPLLNHAIERFLGKTRQEVVNIAKTTLEGSLRGILATMTPEQVNDDMIMFAEKLVQEVEQDMTNLGLVVDTLKIQTVSDEVQYLKSLGRKKNAEVIAKARIAETKAKADSVVVAAENLQKEVEAQINAQIDVAKADAQKRLIDAQTRRAAVVAEEQALVAAQVAKAKADVEVQNARIEQVRRKMEADVVQPAKASCEASEANAKASVASIVEDGKARADALHSLAEQWRASGPNARQLMILQKLDRVVEGVAGIIGDAKIDKVLMIDSKASGLGGDNLATKALVTSEQIKQVFGVDLVEKLKGWGEEQKQLKKTSSYSASAEPIIVPPPTVEPPKSPKLKFKKVN